MPQRSWLTLPSAIAHPVRLLPLAFLTLIVLGTMLLLLPVARSGNGSSEFMPAFFTAASAVTVTGLATVDTGTYWSPAGQGIMVVLVEIGGLGIIAMATILGLFVGGRLGLRTRLVAQADMRVVSIGEVRPLFRRVAITMLFFQSITALVLTIRYRSTYFDELPTALWHGVFDTVMAFNNAGFSLNSDSLTGYAGDGLIIIPISFAVFVGAIGFPVLAELFKEWRTPDRWTIHTRLTVWGSLLLLVIGVILFLALEWSNPGTVGLSTGITPDLPADAQTVIIALMFLGRVGTITAASAFVLRSRAPRYHLPEEQPIIG